MGKLSTPTPEETREYFEKLLSKIRTCTREKPSREQVQRLADLVNTLSIWAEFL